MMEKGDLGFPVKQVGLGWVILVSPWVEFGLMGRLLVRLEYVGLDLEPCCCWRAQWTCVVSWRDKTQEWKIDEVEKLEVQTRET